MGMTCSMLKERGLPNLFWAEAVYTAVYIINISPTKAVHMQTPFEAWHGRKPNITHLKIFGCVVYGLVPPQRRRKLDDKSKKGIFIGYSQESSGFRLYNPETQKLTTRRDVVFSRIKSGIGITQKMKGMYLLTHFLLNIILYHLPFFQLMPLMIPHLLPLLLVPKILTPPPTYLFNLVVSKMPSMICHIMVSHLAPHPLHLL
jgi:hypothetical protein